MDHNNISLGAIAVFHFKTKTSLKAACVTANADDSNNTSLMTSRVVKPV